MFNRAFKSRILIDGLTYGARGGAMYCVCVNNRAAEEVQSDRMQFTLSTFLIKNLQLLLKPLYYLSTLSSLCHDLTMC